MSWKKNRKKEQILPHSGSKSRVKILALFFVVFTGLIVVRLFDLQILKGGFYSALALGQHELYQKIFPERGSIYVLESDGNREKLFPLVTNKEFDMLYAVPVKIGDPLNTAEKLFAILGPEKEYSEKEMADIEKELFSDIDPDMSYKMSSEIKQNRLEQWRKEKNIEEVLKLRDILAKENDPYEPIRGKLTTEQVNEIKDLDIDGLGFKKEVWRYYPEEGIGGHIFGFLGYAGDERKGLYGVEGYYNNLLAGKYGEIKSEKDVWGNIIAIGSRKLEEKTDGADIVLTIDRAIQYKVCQVLYQAADKYKVEAGSVVVLEPKTGAVLAMCGYPDYNPPHYYKEKDINVFNNPAIYNSYEPGSIMKPITMAAAIDSDKVSPNTIYEDEGFLIINEKKINNFNNKVYGKVNMTEVLNESINTGAVFAMRQTTPKVFAKYVSDFGFGKKTKIELDTESAGDTSNLDRSGEIYQATASYGHGMTATVLQMAQAYATIANGGKLMKPTIISKIINKNKPIEEIQPKLIRQVISSKTAKTVSAMLVSVVESGHGGLASVDGYRVAGKTGTAIIADYGSVGYTKDVIVSFAGFAPFSDPRFVMVVRMDRPEEGGLGSSVAAPVFGEIAKFILQYYNVVHDK